jgi:hypothetical protein
VVRRLVASIAAFVVFPVEGGLARSYVATLHVSPTMAPGTRALQAVGWPRHPRKSSMGRAPEKLAV